MIEHTFALERAVDAVRQAVKRLETARLAGSDAARLTRVAAEGERLLATAKALLATRDRLLDGRLSIGQAALVSAGAAVDPAAESHLLKTAARSGMRGCLLYTSPSPRDRS